MRMINININSAYGFSLCGLFMLSSGVVDAQVPATPEGLLEQYPISEHDQRVSGIESFDQVLAGWERRARTGNIMSTYDVQVVATFDPGEPKFEPQPGKTYFYENLGTSTSFYSAGRRAATVEGNQVVVGYGPMSLTGYIGAVNLGQGRVTALRPFWVSRIDPDTWEVVDEYPYPGYRGDWILVDAASEYIYVPGGGSHSITKIELATGAIAWHRATGIGPYGATFNADQSEIWVADKGEANGFFGRTLSVLETATGRQLETVFSGYVVDHVLLSPNGKEMWATANGDAQIFVFDEATREQTHVIDMPNWGEPHGLVWVHYDADGTARVVRDQGGFRGGIDPLAGNVLDY